MAKEPEEENKTEGVGDGEGEPTQGKEEGERDAT
jgi:hypothetical protein